MRELAHLREEVGFGARVERRGRLVEDEEAAASEERAGEGEPLPLPDRELVASVELSAEPRLVSVGQIREEPVGACCGRRGLRWRPRPLRVRVGPGGCCRGRRGGTGRSPGTAPSSRRVPRRARGRSRRRRSTGSGRRRAGRAGRSASRAWSSRSRSRRRGRRSRRAPPRATRHPARSCRCPGSGTRRSAPRGR